jgi:protein gp37
MTTKIEWSTHTFNPIVGCRKVSLGCEHCYAERMANRLAGMGKSNYLEVVDYYKGGWNGEVSLCTQKHWDSIPKSGMCFVGSMSDLFYDKVPFRYLDEIYSELLKHPNATYQILTKRPGRALEYYQSAIADADEHDGLPCPIVNAPNIWFGATAENQEWADKRIPILLQIPAALHFVSLEPLIGAVDISPWLHGESHEQSTEREQIAARSSERRMGYRYKGTDLEGRDTPTCGEQNSAGVLTGAKDDRGKENPLWRSQACVEIFQRSDSRGYDDQSHKWGEGGQSPGEFRDSNVQRTGDSCKEGSGKMPAVGGGQSNCEVDECSGGANSRTICSGGIAPARTGQHVQHQRPAYFGHRKGKNIPTASGSNRELQKATTENCVEEKCAGAISWAIIGEETGPGRRPCKLEWIADIVAQCHAAEVPVFVKAIYIGSRKVNDAERMGEALGLPPESIRQWPTGRNA